VRAFAWEFDHCPLPIARFYSIFTKILCFDVAIERGGTSALVLVGGTSRTRSAVAPLVGGFCFIPMSHETATSMHHSLDKAQDDLSTQISIQEPLWKTHPSRNFVLKIIYFLIIQK
jgi:hypothetical protein